MALGNKISAAINPTPANAKEPVAVKETATQAQVVQEEVDDLEEEFEETPDETPETEQETGAEAEAEAEQEEQEEEETISSLPNVSGEDEDVFSVYLPKTETAPAVTTPSAPALPVDYVSRIAAAAGLEATTVEELEQKLKASRSASFLDMPESVELAFDKKLISYAELKSGVPEDVNGYSNEYAIRMDRLARGFSPERVEAYMEHLMESADTFRIEDEADEARLRLLDKKKTALAEFGQVRTRQNAARESAVRDTHSQLQEAQAKTATALKAILEKGIVVDGVPIPKVALVAAAKTILNPNSFREAFFGNENVTEANLAVGMQNLASFFAQKTIVEKKAKQAAVDARKQVMATGGTPKGANALPAAKSKETNKNKPDIGDTISNLRKANRI